MATIQDIANEVGISKAAVSRILNRKGSFNAGTKEKVFRVAKDLGYLVPRENQLLDEKFFKTIGAVFPTGHIPYYSVLVSLLEQVAYSFGYSLMICSSLYDKEKEELFFEQLREKRISGIIYGSFTNDVNLPINEDLPIVTVGHRLSEDIPVIKSDNHLAGIIAAKHLIAKGCTNLLYISAYQVGKNNDERYKGFIEELEKSNKKCNAYFTGTNERKKDIPSVISQMFIENVDADGIFVESYTLAVQCLKVCQSLGISIPEDLKIVTYGNQLLNAYSFPEITMISENTNQIAYEAVSALVDIIEHEDNTEPDLKDNQIVIPVSLIEKQTT
ncbi:LacI family DNA-binding transcriptional regulator [Marinilactibacillus psychrotolerans]|uniref:Sucrose operon repressor n=1 Tax=Marinilactibacillus psychrotolerans TaxID=191770 RepID=A0AAV3WUE1_9LACT|nr:LacI family DNA-binding transcriptional regulator [Marinilactibacillus psychrotolerans]GEL66836.1 LacI family transcriptional regulator [Marinilactibacillus psychrotolerans]GEQ35717.1 sucrose operon repressor [Marinilactibacillus psychrotolerans]SDC36457.1 LacI family transcriptional regulator, sucrose operon repressor [Marinilactibacillus psychrotolerans]